jgi:hypothetical protein
MFLPGIYSPGGKTTQAVGDDPKDVFAVISISYTPRVEVWWYETEPGTDRFCVRNPHRGSSINGLNRRIIVPKSVRINSRESVRALNYPPNIQIRTSNPEIAIITAPPNMVVIPISMGDCNIIVATPNGDLLEQYPLRVTL